jgi:predicted dehydrogenase
VRTPVTVGVIGLGATGRRLARLLAESPAAELRWLCDSSAKALVGAHRSHPGSRATAAAGALLVDEGLDAVVVATPFPERWAIACAALAADKHVLVLGPAAPTAELGQALVAAAERAARQLDVVHEPLFDPAVRKLKEVADAGRLGELYYLAVDSEDASARGDDVGVLWTLGADAVALALYLLDDEPVGSATRVETYESVATEVAAYQLTFATGITVWGRLSCLHPQRTLRVSVVGSRRAAVYDDVRAERRLTVLDRSPSGRPERQGRSGEIVAPCLARNEPLATACDAFLLRTRGVPDLASARLAAAAVAVVESLEGATTSAGAGLPEGQDRMLRLVGRT